MQAFRRVAMRVHPDRFHAERGSELVVVVVVVVIVLIVVVT